MEKKARFEVQHKAEYDKQAKDAAARPFSQLRERMKGDALSGSLDRREQKRLRTEEGAADDKGCQQAAQGGN